MHGHINLKFVYTINKSAKLQGAWEISCYRGVSLLRTYCWSENELKYITNLRIFIKLFEAPKYYLVDTAFPKTVYSSMVYYKYHFRNAATNPEIRA